MHLLKRDRRKTPRIYALFLLGYLALFLLLGEQNRTIVTQSTLIRSLYEDSRMLATLQMKKIAQQHQAEQPAPEPQAK